MTATLEATLEYQNKELVYYFSNYNGISLAEAEELFIDLKKWLWLCGQLDDSSRTVHLFQEQDIIDQFWHCFLLFTRDYIIFCETYCGTIICHHPEPHLRRVRQKEKLRSNPGLVIKENLSLLRESMEEVGRVLGAETAWRWYHDIPVRYGARGA